MGLEGSIGGGFNDGHEDLNDNPSPRNISNEL